jgi:dTDP-4-dehydrorhamnose reductase
VNAAIERYRPWAIVNTAGYVRVDDAEVESEACMRENTLGPSVLAGACASYGIQLVTFSSDLVFSGNKRAAYVESDPVGPLNVYGHSKAEAERAVLDLLPSALIVRASAFFGPWDRYNFVTATLRALSDGQKFVASSDYTVSPTYVPDLVNASLDLLLDGARGIWHLANSGAVKWSTLAEMAAEYAGLSTASLVRCANCQWMFTAPRPAYSVLGSERARFMPSLEDALLRYLHHPDLSWRKDVERAPQQESSGDVAA